ncbi:unnamed protein product [Rotaria sp. Silwood2]|nr:unnamed protein product [Rotaria sp. Silwood2]
MVLLILSKKETTRLLLIAIGIDKKFFLLYSHLGDFWDLTSISSSFITFVMYCSMSQQFRLEMISLILPSSCIKKSKLDSKQISLTTKINLKQIQSQNCSLMIEKNNKYSRRSLI